MNRKYQACGQLLEIIGDYWTLAIILELVKGPLRFNQLQRAVTGINAVTLTARLKKLEAATLVKRQEEACKLPVVYSLSPKGRSLLPIVISIKKQAESF